MAIAETDLIELGFDRHAMQCPHCQKRGKAILFATANCVHCGRDFLIALNKPQAAS
jgi:DNA-directed RNA polymerase subunit RPC12/RpoP